MTVPMDCEQLKPILEAALLASPKPMTPVQLAELFDLVERPSLDTIAQTLAALVEDSAGRGVELVEVATGFRYQIRTEVFPHLGALWTERQSRYSRALLETLALIAYRQPITRGEIEQIRGVGVATSILRTIEEREWVRVVGHRDVPGRPALYGTTKAFLDYFQIKSLDELPPLSALSDLDNVEPELMLGIDSTQADASAANDDAPAATVESDSHAADAENEPDSFDTDTDASIDVDDEPGYTPAATDDIADWADETAEDTGPGPEAFDDDHETDPASRTTD